MTPKAAQSRYYYPVLTGVNILGLAVMVLLRPDFTAHSLAGLLMFAVMTLIAEASPTVLPNGQETVSVGFALVLAGILLFGPRVGIWLAAIGTISPVELTGKVRFERFLFNRAQLALSAAAAGYLYVAFGGHPGQVNLARDIVALVSCGLGYMIVNSILVVAAICVITEQDVREVWLSQRKMLASANYLVLVPLAILIAMVYAGVGPMGVILFVLPLLVARFALQRYVDTERLLIGTINALVRAIEARDEYTSGHSERVKVYASATAKEMGLPPETVRMIEYLASLHDIGKIGIRDQILGKDGPLTAEEYAEIKQHPTMGATILSQIEAFGNNVDMIKHHHEHYDGTGYPTGLSGDAIPLGARIIAVCDAYDAMTSHRPYRRAKTPAEALLELQRCAGSQFDPQVVKAFSRIIPQFELTVR